MVFSTTPLYYEWDKPEVPIIIGGALSLVRVITTIVAHNDIGKAGIALKGNSIVIPLNN